MGYTRIYGILYFELKRTPPIPLYIRFGIEILGWCRNAIDRRFLALKSRKNNVNLPAYTLAPAAPIPSYTPFANPK